MVKDYQLVSVVVPDTFNARSYLDALPSFASFSIYHNEDNNCRRMHHSSGKKESIDVSTKVLLTVRKDFSFIYLI
jgi:hypothetical protein